MLIELCGCISNDTADYSVCGYKEPLISDDWWGRHSLSGLHQESPEGLWVLSFWWTRNKTVTGE